MSCTLSGTHPSAIAAFGIFTIAIAFTFGIVQLAVMIVVGLQGQCPAQHRSRRQGREHIHHLVAVIGDGVSGHEDYEHLRHSWRHKGWHAITPSSIRTLKHRGCKILVSKTALSASHISRSGFHRIARYGKTKGGGRAPMRRARQHP